METEPVDAFLNTNNGKLNPLGGHVPNMDHKVGDGDPEPSVPINTAAVGKFRATVVLVVRTPANICSAVSVALLVNSVIPPVEVSVI